MFSCAPNLARAGNMASHVRMKDCFGMVLLSDLVPKKGLEPPHPCEYMDLNHARLPIPPLRHLEKAFNRPVERAVLLHHTTSAARVKYGGGGKTGCGMGAERAKKISRARYAAMYDDCNARKPR